MTKVSLWAVAVMVLAQTAFAVVDPTWERPILASYDMLIKDPRFAFEKLDRADLILQKRDGMTQPTSLTVVLHQDGKTQKVPLVIKEIQQQKCGTVRYIAALKDSDPLGARFNVVLDDHTVRKCKDHKPYRWEASVRSGFGWCGTMDATMSLYGNPEEVISIQ